MVVATYMHMYKYSRCGVMNQFTASSLALRVDCPCDTDIALEGTIYTGLAMNGHHWSFELCSCYVLLSYVLCHSAIYTGLYILLLCFYSLLYI